MITIIAAASENNVIGFKGQIPWRLPNDFKMFKDVTMGHPMIMGRKTFESLPGILPGRHHFVISRFAGDKKEGVTHVGSPAQAIEATRGEEKYVIGGGEIYKQFLDFADSILLTRVFTTCEGDAFFPEIPSDFRLINYDYHVADEKHEYCYAFMEYVRIRKQQ